ncbi:Fe-S cluster assembly protein SufD [Anaeromyxobacter oryzae]|uniref:Fe-S cluster assembly protein SufD n=1 Tax=Anaeromyxobacter oryzae TaxID=2918170 RepID=A0ABM7WYC3_9BACT|nr:Fe-S cluster assembly protein SufD [Anaeromyxobacter oryzae]BDG04529.1 Fe-S cluster assembly protein SufD [Anaeromyxobacter oryzae]
MTTAAAASLAALHRARPEPGWLAQARGAALARFRTLGLPTTRDEDWRFTNLAPLAAVTFGPAPEEDGAAARLLASAPGPAGARLVFENGRFRRDLSSGAQLPAGAVLASLADALRHAPDAVRPHLGRLASPDALPFVAANAALLEDGAFLLLPRGVAVEAPIELVFVTGAAHPVSAQPRVLVVAEAGARATLAEIYVGTGDVYLVNAVTELVLGEGARIEHVKLQDEGVRAFHVSTIFAEQAAASRLVAHGVSLGAQIGRSEIRARLAGEGAEIAVSGLFMADATRVQDAFSWVEHAVPRCTTTETYKGILDGRSRGVFSGRIRVLPGAQKTSAYQMSSNLLLSDDAVVDTKPQLEIFADDVKCGHGGTVGQLDEASLFYLRSRGVPEAEARSLLIWAFAAEMVDRVSPTALRARAKALVAARLPAGARVLEAA